MLGDVAIIGGVAKYGAFRSLAVCALGSVFAVAVIIRALRVEEHDGSNEPADVVMNVVTLPTR